MCLEDIAISRSARLKTVTLSVPADRVRVPNNPDRIAVFPLMTNAIDQPRVMLLDPALAEPQRLPSPSTGGSATGSLTVSSHPGIVTLEHWWYATAAVITGYIEVTLDPMTSMAIQEMSDR